MSVIEINLLGNGEETQKPTEDEQEMWEIAQRQRDKVGLPPMPALQQVEFTDWYRKKKNDSKRLR